MSPQFRTAVYFFVQFMSGGAFHTYAGIWFSSLGFTPNQIAALTTFPTFVVLLVNVFVGRIADRARDWRQALVIGSCLSFIFACGLIVSQNYAAVFLFWSLSLIAQTLITPIADAAALYLTRQGRGQIGTLRSFSTLGYVVSLFVTGFLTVNFGGAIFALLFAGLSGLRYMASLAMPDFKTTGDKRSPAAGINILQYLRLPWLFLPLLGWATVYSTLQVLNSFLALIFSQQGLSESTISLLIACGAIAEAIVFYLFRHVSQHVDLRLMILLSCIVTVIRWAAMAQQPGLPALFVLQSLHGITYALGFISCISYISRHTPPENAAEVQSIFNVLQLITAIVSVTTFGRLMQSYGSQAFWGSAAIATIGVILTSLSFRYRPPHVS